MNAALAARKTSGKRRQGSEAIDGIFIIGTRVWQPGVFPGALRRDGRMAWVRAIVANPHRLVMMFAVLVKVPKFAIMAITSFA